MTEPNELKPDAISWDEYRPFAMYAEGLPVTEIAIALKQAPGTVYNHLRELPSEYAKAKDKRAAHRVAKYRRVGSLAVDLQIKTLEDYEAVMAGDDDDAKADVRARVKDIAAIGESAERRADLNEGKVTERTEFNGKMTVADMMALAESVRARN